MATFLLEIVTPDKIVLKEEVEMAICPGVEGEFGVLPHHISILAALRIGALRYRANNQEETVFIGGGFLDMNENKCNVLAESAERAKDIDVSRAQQARERAEARLKGKKEDLDEIRANVALKRAIMRLNIANKAL